MKSQNGHTATRRTVIIAGVANIVVGLAKLAAGIISGSSAMLAEAAHSAADTLNQVFLLTSLRQADRPADPDHPFGHGQERYFWSLLAAFGIFIAGAGFSIFEGLLSLTRSHGESPLAAYVTLAVAFAAEGTSFARAFWQVRGEARSRREKVLDHVESSPDITVKVNLFEDSAAVVGLILAALGVGLGQLTGSPVWDGAASIAIGLLLVAVAIKLGMDSRELLIGRSATWPTPHLGSTGTIGLYAAAPRSKGASLTREHQIRRSGRVVQDCPSMVVGWADIPGCPRAPGVVQRLATVAAERR